MTINRCVVPGDYGARSGRNSNRGSDRPDGLNTIATVGSVADAIASLNHHVFADLSCLGQSRDRNAGRLAQAQLTWISYPPG